MKRIIFADADELEKALRTVEMAHKASGHPDQDWPNWYAKWLAERYADD